MKEVYILTRHVPYEFTDIYEVCATKELAEEALHNLRTANDYGIWNEDEWSIELWSVTEKLES